MNWTIKYWKAGTTYTKTVYGEYKEAVNRRFLEEHPDCQVLSITPKTKHSQEEEVYNVK